MMIYALQTYPYNLGMPNINENYNTLSPTLRVCSHQASAAPLVEGLHWFIPCHSHQAAASAPIQSIDSDAAANARCLV